MSTDAIAFPPDFLWGTSTAAYQVEGAACADGRGPSIWDTFSHSAGSTRNGDTGDRACDQYRHLDGDLDLIGDLGANAYRFSVSWPRVQPCGRGPTNPRGIDFYRRLVAGLHQRGVTPVLTLYHWDLPQALEDAGGWVKRDTSSRFADYVAVVAEALHSEVDLWITLNEPWCAAWLGYGSGVHAPGGRDLGRAAAAAHHLLLAHGLAVEVLRQVAPRTRIGVSLNLSPIRPASSHQDDLAAARRVDGNLNRMFLDPLFKGAYPCDVLRHYGNRRPGFSAIREGDLDLIRAELDFIGINYYSPQTAAAPERLDAARRAGYSPGRRRDPVSEDLGSVPLTRAEASRTAMDWEIEPAGLTELLARLRACYHTPPVYITENGAAFDDYVGPDGAVHDGQRIDYLDGHLRAIHRALAAGSDVRGYFVWSLLDNFEWAEGYSKRFGLTWVDYPTSARTPKDSYRWYQRVVSENRLETDLSALPARCTR